MIQPTLSVEESRSKIEEIFRAQSDEIVSLYRQHIPEYLHSLKLAIARNDRDQIAYRSHKMCSAMKTMGFLTSAERLQLIERRQNNADELASLVDEVEVFVQTSLDVLDSRQQ